MKNKIPLSPEPPSTDELAALKVLLPDEASNPFGLNPLGCP